MNNPPAAFSMTASDYLYMLDCAYYKRPNAPFL